MMTHQDTAHSLVEAPLDRQARFHSAPRRDRERLWFAGVGGFGFWRYPAGFCEPGWLVRGTDLRAKARPRGEKEIGMRVVIHGQGVDMDRFTREYVQRRLQFALARFSTRIREVGVRLVDVNGDRGGTDQYCRILAHMIPSGTIVIEDMDANPLAAIDRAADRAGRAVARELRRRWEPKRRAALRGRLRRRGESRAYRQRE